MLLLLFCLKGYIPFDDLLLLLGEPFSVANPAIEVKNSGDTHEAGRNGF